MAENTVLVPFPMSSLVALECGTSYKSQVLSTSVSFTAECFTGCSFSSFQLTTTVLRDEQHTLKSSSPPRSETKFNQSTNCVRASVSVKPLWEYEHTICLYYWGPGLERRVQKSNFQLTSIRCRECAATRSTIVSQSVYFLQSLRATYCSRWRHWH